MPSAAQRAKKAAAKAAQRKAVVAQKKRIEQQATSLPGRIAAAAPCPIERCARSTELFDAGIGYVVLARRLPSNLICCAIFLVDVYCLGVKDVFYKEYSPSDFDDTLDKLGGATGFLDIEPAAARKLVRESVAYTAEFGLPPAKTYAVIETMFGDVEASRSQEVFTFGMDGKPFYVQGPRDKPDRVRQIMRALTARFGAEGWNFTIETGRPPGLGGEDDDDDDGFLGDDAALAEGLGLDETGVLDDVEFRRIEAESETKQDP